jgi:hypothetical protein
MLFNAHQLVVAVLAALSMNVASATPTAAAMEIVERAENTNATTGAAAAEFTINVGHRNGPVLYFAWESGKPRCGGASQPVSWADAYPLVANRVSLY